MKTCLVTGCTGLIGSHLIPSLIEDGWHVYGITRSQNKWNDISNYYPIVIDLASGFDINTLPKKVDVIIHLAQSRNFREFPELATDIFRVNTETTLMLLNYARKAQVKKFVLASTGGVYGTGKLSFSENSELANYSDLGFYASTKLCSEILVNNYNSLFDVNILRLFFVYGQGQHRSMLIPRIVYNIVDNLPVTLNGENGILINPIHVSDAISAIICSLTTDKKSVINIGGLEILSLREISEIIGDKLNCSPNFNVQLQDDSKNLIADISKMIKYLNVPKISFQKGIDNVIEEVLKLKSE
jgi:UDP-glucose 4-epimerase